MGSADQAATTALPEPKQCAHHAQLSSNAESMHLLFKNHMEFGAAFLKMSA
jgi:hypothetical protein